MQNLIVLLCLHTCLYWDGEISIVLCLEPLPMKLAGTPFILVFKRFETYCKYLEPPSTKENETLEPPLGCWLLPITIRT